MMALPTFADVAMAALRIRPYVQTTPLLESQRLNEWLGHRILFKAECLQTTGAFKLRGATNFIARRAAAGTLPAQVVANSSGNHAQAVAYAAKRFGVQATIYAAKSISRIKAAATESYGATVKLFDTRVLADAAVQQAQGDDCLWIPPYNHPDIIAGQGTVALEALTQLETIPDAVFAPCGGGGLLSGTLLSCRAQAASIQVIGTEPLQANDAAASLRAGSIQTLTAPPDTLADGAATPSVGDYTFPLLQQLDDFYEVSETAIIYWTQWLHHLLKIHVEPTCAMSMDGVRRWLSQQSSSKTVLVLLSGGNISQAAMAKLYQQDHLVTLPCLKEVL